MLVDVFEYQFVENWRIPYTQEELDKGVLIKLHMGVTGVKLANEKYRAYINNIQFIPNRKTLVTREDYEDVTVVFGDNISEKVDKEQVSEVEYFARVLYRRCWVNNLVEEGIIKEEDPHDILF